MSKAVVKLGGVPLAGNNPIIWQFQTGTQPYVTTFSVHNSDWGKLSGKMVTPLTLQIKDSRGRNATIKGVYILHTAPSDSPNRTAFVVSDRRYLWSYPMIARDYNITKKSGDRSNLQDRPVENLVVVDVYDFKPYSLKDGTTKWTAKDAVTDVLEQLEGGTGAKGGKNYVIESFPIGGSGDGQFTLQNIMLRDQGDVALARLLSYVPAAEVYIDKEGMVRVIDAADFQAMEEYNRKQLKDSTYDGEVATLVDRKWIRPARVAVYYQREVECVFEFEDDTTVVRTRDAPFLENVLSTPDVETTMLVRDETSETGTAEVDVAMGTWVEFYSWLNAMDRDKPEGSFAWDFETIKVHWLPPGDLAGALGANQNKFGDVIKEKVNIPLRVHALRQYYRSHFRINPRYMDRVRDIQAVRAGVLDPVTGARAPASVWGEAHVFFTLKGSLMASRKDPEKNRMHQNISSLPDEGESLITKPAGPARIIMLDRDQGIFRVEWVLSPYATNSKYVPCHLTNPAGKPTAISRNMAKQDEEPMGIAMTSLLANTGIFLSRSMGLKVMLTIAPAAPNNKNQFHVEMVEASDIKDVFQKEYRIQGGQGPTLEVFIPPSELTARFQWLDDDLAEAGVKDLLGLGDPDPNTAGLRDDPNTPKVDESDLTSRGFGFVNQRRDLVGHSKAVAAEVLSVFADNLQGAVATAMPKDGLKLIGNMSTAVLQVSAASSAKVNAIHMFPGQAREISRLALMPEYARHMVLGIIKFGDER